MSSSLCSHFSSSAADYSRNNLHHYSSTGQPVIGNKVSAFTNAWLINTPEIVKDLALTNPIRGIGNFIKLQQVLVPLIDSSVCRT